MTLNTDADSFSSLHRDAATISDTSSAPTQPAIRSVPPPSADHFVVPLPYSTKPLKRKSCSEINKAKEDAWPSRYSASEKGKGKAILSSALKAPSILQPATAVEPIDRSADSTPIFIDGDEGDDIVIIKPEPKFIAPRNKVLVADDEDDQDDLTRLSILPLRRASPPKARVGYRRAESCPPSWSCIHQIEPLEITIESERAYLKAKTEPKLQQSTREHSAFSSDLSELDERDAWSDADRRRHAWQLRRARHRDWVTSNKEALSIYSIYSNIDNPIKDPNADPTTALYDECGPLTDWDRSVKKLAQRVELANATDKLQEIIIWSTQCLGDPMMPFGAFKIPEHVDPPDLNAKRTKPKTPKSAAETTRAAKKQQAMQAKQELLAAQAAAESSDLSDVPMDVDQADVLSIRSRSSSLSSLASDYVGPVTPAPKPKAKRTSISTLTLNPRLLHLTSSPRAAIEDSRALLTAKAEFDDDGLEAAQTVASKAARKQRKANWVTDQAKAKAKGKSRKRQSAARSAQAGHRKVSGGSQLVPASEWEGGDALVCPAYFRSCRRG